MDIQALQNGKKSKLIGAISKETNIMLALAKPAANL